MKKVLTVVFGVMVLGFTSPNTFAQTGFNAVLEYCTGTWCQYCPCGETVIEGIKFNYPRTMCLGYHGPVGSSDPWTAVSAPMISAFGFNAYPTGVINRADSVLDRSSWQNRVLVSYYGFQPGVSIAINGYNYNAGTHTITASVVATALSTLSGNYNIMMVLTEDNIIYGQTGNSGCPGSGTYVHKYVVKGLINGAMGTPLATTDTWTQGTTATTPLNYTFPAGVVDANCVLNIFVYKNAGGYIGVGNTVQQSTFVPATTGPTGIVNNNNNTPTEYSLMQNYPNPFNPTTNVHFSLPKDGNVSLKIYDMLGNVVETYVDGFMKSGTYNAEIDGSNWASGVYFYTLRAGNYVETKKMSLIK